MNNVEELLKVQEQLYSMSENWRLLKPHLNDKEVQKVLDEAMTSFCKQYDRKWQSGNAPWEYTTSDYWDMKILDFCEEDEKFQEEQNELFIKIYGINSDEDEDDLWHDLHFTEEYQALELKYFNKYAPQKDTIEWYQFKHGCHWINEFAAALISKALNVEAFVWQTEKHTCVQFVENDVIYFADILNEWETLQELLAFMGEEDVDFYSIF